MMATTYVFARGSWLGEAEYPELDPEGACTEEQVARMREAYEGYLVRKIAEYDDTLIWQPALSEVWGEVGSTASDPMDFEGWFRRSGVCEDALAHAWEQADE